jgi:Recombinase
MQPEKSVAMAHARSLVTIFAAIDHLSADDAAATLNARGVPTPRGKPWSAVMVIRTRNRIRKIARGE